MKKAYIEIGNGCFSRCVTCHVHDYKQTGHSFTTSVVLKTVKELIKNKFGEVRFTGFDPLTYENFKLLMETIRTLDINKVVNTTLLSPDIAKIEACTWVDELIVSLSAIGDNYKTYFKVDKFHVLDRNLRYVLPRLQGKLTFNYTIFKDNCSIEFANQFLNYLGSLPYKDKINVMFFPAMSFDLIDEITARKVKEFGEYLVPELAGRYTIPSRFTEDFGGKKMSKCDVHKERLYIRYNGDVYTCCMGGGELGQELVPELKLGNVLENSIESITDMGVKNVCNKTCDHCSPKYYKLNAYEPE